MNEKLNPTPVQPGDETWDDLPPSPEARQLVDSSKPMTPPVLSPLATRGPKPASAPTLKKPASSHRGEGTPSSPSEPAPYSEPDKTPATGAVAMGTTRASAPPGEASKPTSSPTTTMRWSVAAVQKAAEGLTDPNQPLGKVGPSKTLMGMQPLVPPQATASAKAPPVAPKSLPKPATAPTPPQRPPPLPRSTPVGSYHVVPEPGQAVEEIPSLDPLPDSVPPPPAPVTSPPPVVTSITPVVATTPPALTPAQAAVLAAEPVPTLVLQPATPASAMGSTYTVAPPAPITPRRQPFGWMVWLARHARSFFSWLRYVFSRK